MEDAPGETQEDAVRDGRRGLVFGQEWMDHSSFEEE